MRYVLLIYSDEQVWAQMSAAEQQQVMSGYAKLRDELLASGQFESGSRLLATSVATSVKVREGKLLVTDGPFAETREQLGGYFVIAVADLDAAIRVAERMPTAQAGTIEIRPLPQNAGS